jgi:hypothetical protein
VPVNGNPQSRKIDGRQVRLPRLVREDSEEIHLAGLESCIWAIDPLEQLHRGRYVILALILATTPADVPGWRIAGALLSIK